ncbi:hypothetical protein D3C84_910430 [compost metagenome]
MDGQRGRWHQPPVETGPGDDAFLGKERGLVGLKAVRRDARGHCVSPNYYKVRQPLSALSLYARRHDCFIQGKLVLCDIMPRRDGRTEEG